MTKEEYAALPGRYKNLVRNAVLTVSPALSFDEVDELEQEVWVKGVSYYGSYDPSKGAQVQTWLHRMAVSVAVDAVRRKNAAKRPDIVYSGELVQQLEDEEQVEYYDCPEYGFAPSPEEVLMAEQLEEEIQMRVQDMTEYLQTQWHLRDYDVSNVSSVTGVSPDGVRKARSRARALLGRTD